MRSTNYKLQITNDKQFQNTKYQYLNLFKPLNIGALVLFIIWCLGFGVSAWAREVFVGVFREGAPRNMNYIKKYEQQAGKKPAMVMWYQDWAQPFPAEDAQKVISYGAIPHIVWEPWFWSDHNKINLKDINSGKWDSYIASWAKQTKTFGQPIFLRPLHEFNMEGYPWGLIHNGKDPQAYINAFRRIVNLFKKENATNARFVWAPMNYSFPNESWNDWIKSYPGDEYVDWIGFDGYNWGNTQSWSDWQVLKYLFRDQVRRVRRLWPKKPIMIAEFASTEQGGDKAAWIREIPGYLRSSMRDIDALLWFDEKKESDWRINSSEKSLAAFKQIMKDPLFSSSGEGLANYKVPTAPREKKVAIASRAQGEIKLNGNLDEWKACLPLVMKDALYFKEGLEWEGPADLSGDIYLMWDDLNLYLAADVTDSRSPINNKQKGDIWNGDGVEIVLGTDPAADPKRESFARGDYQLGLGAGNGRDNLPSIWSWQRYRMPKGSEIVVKKTAKGYLLEAKIPWEFFVGFSPVAGARLGFDVAIDDAKKTGEREKQFIWNGDYYFYKDPSVWGILELGR